MRADRGKALRMAVGYASSGSTYRRISVDIVIIIGSKRIATKRGNANRLPKGSLRSSFKLDKHGTQVRIQEANGITILQHRMRARPGRSCERGQGPPRGGAVLRLRTLRDKLLYLSCQRDK